MERIYTSCKCKSCKREFILLTENVKYAKNKGRYICCPHCSSKKIEYQKECDGVKECMEHSVYRRENGALRQIK